MSEREQGEQERRVLVLAPTARDAALSQTLLTGAGIQAEVCEDMLRLCSEAEAGAGALLLTEEALTPAGLACLAGLVERQPPWSDLPLLVLTRGGVESERAALTDTARGNVTLLDRPVRVGILLSAVRTALRARKRQYQLREHMAGQEADQAALRDADHRKDEFLAMLAHELRNPLAAIVSATALLRHSDAPEAVRQRQPEVIDRQARHVARLLDDLLDMSRITHGRIELRRQLLDLADVVRDSIAGCRRQIDDRSQRLEVSLPPGPIPLEGDPARLEQVFTNLLTNAAKYTEPGGEISLTVGVESRELRVESPAGPDSGLSTLNPQPSTAVISVRDSGAGISSELLPHVFDLFTQGERTLGRSEGGLGIGLTLVRRLVELHGGSVSVRSDGTGQGSEFTVTLPLERGTRIADRGMEADDRPSSSPIPRSAIRVPRSRRVLVIEDNADAAQTLQDLMEIWGHQVATAASGEEGLVLARDFVPEVVLIDVGLPGMDGYEVAARFRADERLRGACLVAVTGYGRETDRRRARSAGFDHHLTKPVDAETVRALLDTAPAFPPYPASQG